MTTSLYVLLKWNLGVKYVDCSRFCDVLWGVFLSRLRGTTPWWNSVRPWLFPADETLKARSQEYSHTEGLISGVFFFFLKNHLVKMGFNTSIWATFFYLWFDDFHLDFINFLKTFWQFFPPPNYVTARRLKNMWNNTERIIFAVSSLPFFLLIVVLK